MLLKLPSRCLTNRFEMKYLGVADVILVIKISRTSNGLMLSQYHYIDKVLDKLKKYEIKPMRSPVNVNINFSKNKGNRIS